jgi:inosose dehydratase
VDFPAVLKRLQSLDYRGWIVVEQDVLPSMGSPAASAARNRQFLRQLGV